MTLHLVFSPAGWSSCQLRLSTSDSVILLGDGVYVAGQIEQPQISVVGEDLEIRGCKAPARASVIDYQDMVELCTQHNPIVSWND